MITSRLQWAVAFRDRIVPPSAYTVQASSTSLSVLCAGDGEDVARAAARSSHSLGKIFVVDEGEPQGGCGDAVERLQGVSVAGVPLPRAGADSPPSQAMHGLCFLAFPHPAGDATRDEDALQRVVTELRRRMQPRCVAVWVRQRAPGPESEQAPLLRPESLRRIAAGTGAAHWEASSALGLLALAWGANEPEPGTGEQQQSDAAKDGGAAPPHGLPSACPARHEDHSPTVASGSQFGDLFARSHATEASSAERSLWPRLRALVASRVRGSEWATESLMGVVEPLARRQAASLAAQGQGQGPGDGGEVTSDADIYAALATAFHDHVRTDSRYKPPKPGANGGANAGASGAAAGAEIPRKRPCPGPAPAGPATEATRSAGKPKPRRQDHLVRKAMRAFPGNGRFRARSLLDVGCAEGNVTAELGRQLGVPPDALHGCDVRAVAAKEHRGFDFRQYDGQSLPYAECAGALPSSSSSPLFAELPSGGLTPPFPFSVPLPPLPLGAAPRFTWCPRSWSCTTFDTRPAWWPRWPGCCSPAVSSSSGSTTAPCAACLCSWTSCTGCMRWCGSGRQSGPSSSPSTKRSTGPRTSGTQ